MLQEGRLVPAVTGKLGQHGHTQGLPAQAMADPSSTCGRKGRSSASTLHSDPSLDQGLSLAMSQLARTVASKQRCRPQDSAHHKARSQQGRGQARVPRAA
jgi:hypothetical protein